MCPPALIAVAAVAGAAATVKGVSDANKARKQAAAQARKAAEQEKRVADQELRKSRADDYSTRRGTQSRNPQADAGSLFAPRSFFAAA